MKIRTRSPIMHMETSPGYPSQMIHSFDIDCLLWILKAIKNNKITRFYHKEELKEYNPITKIFSVWEERLFDTTIVYKTLYDLAPEDIKKAIICYRLEYGNNPNGKIEVYYDKGEKWYFAIGPSPIFG